MIAINNEKLILEKVQQLPYNLQLDALKFIDYLIFMYKNNQQVEKKNNVFDKFYGIAENFWNEDAQEYINKLRD